VGEVVTAALLNQEIAGQFNSFFGAWSTYTPTWTATGSNPSLGNGTLTGRYLQVGRRYDVHIELTCGSTTTYGSGNYSFSLPVAAAAAGTGNRVGHAQALVTGARYGGQVVISPTASTTSPFFPPNSTTSSLSQGSPSVPGTWASGNSMRMTLTYESAS
jgi:hypothetical protein